MILLMLLAMGLFLGALSIGGAILALLEMRKHQELTFWEALRRV